MSDELDDKIEMLNDRVYSFTAIHEAIIKHFEDIARIEQIATKKKQIEEL
jgi:hypothetical protein